MNRVLVPLCQAESWGGETELFRNRKETLVVKGWEQLGVSTNIFLSEVLRIF